MSHRRYVIMANGRGSRWGGHLGIPKQLIEIGGETLLARIARQVSQFDQDAEIIVSSSDQRHETPGARRHTPRRNEIELDRFVDELLEDDTCFLYGDTYYTNQAMRAITSSNQHPLGFFGDAQSIVGISCRNASLMREHLDTVRNAYLSGKLSSCIGWQVYQSYTNQLFQPLEIDCAYGLLTGQIAGFNSPEDLRQFIDRMGQDWDASPGELNEQIMQPQNL